MRIDFPTFIKRYTPDKDKFPFGMRLYLGEQGSGKSLTMIYDLRKIYNQFGDVSIISNIKLNLPADVDYQYYNDVQGLIDCIDYVEQQRIKHVLILIDEGLTYFAENGGIDPALMSKITQNRKNRRLMMISTQKFERLNNRLRDFSLESVDCRHFGNIQYNIVRDDQKLAWDRELMRYTAPKKYSYVFKRNNELFRLYDTFQVIKLDTNTKTGSLLGDKSPPVSLSSGKKGLVRRKAVR